MDTDRELAEHREAQDLVSLTGRLEWPTETVPARLRRLMDEVWRADGVLVALLSALEAADDAAMLPTRRDLSDAIEAAKEYIAQAPVRRPPVTGPSTAQAEQDKDA